MRRGALQAAAHKYSMYETVWTKAGQKEGRGKVPSSTFALAQTEHIPFY